MSLTVGLVGCGRWGTHHLSVLNILQHQARIKDIIVCDIDEQKLKNLNATKIYRSIEEMLDQERLDAVAIVTPPETHVELVIRTLKHRIPTLVEKPLSLDRRSTEQLLEHITSSDTIVVGYLLRHHPGIKQIKEALEKQKFGTNLTFSYIRTTTRTKPSGADALTSLAVHGLDLTTWFLEQKIMEMHTNISSSSRDDVHIQLESKLSSSATISVGWGADEEQRIIEINGTKGHARLDFGSGLLQWKNVDQTGSRSFVEQIQRQPLMAEWDFFLDAAMKKKPIIFPPKMELLDQIEWLHHHNDSN